MTAGAAMRLEISGIDAAGEPQRARMEGADPALTFACYFSPDRNGEASIALGFTEAHDLILRVLKTEPNFTPVIGKKVRLLRANSDGTDLVLRITTAGTSGINPEQVIGCKAVI